MTVFRLTGPGSPVSQGPTGPDTGLPDLPDTTRPLGLKEAFLEAFRSPSRTLAVTAAIGVSLTVGTALQMAAPTIGSAGQYVSVAAQISPSETGGAVAFIDGPVLGPDEGNAGSVQGGRTRHLDPDDAWVMETIAAALHADFSADQIATNSRFNSKEVTSNVH